MSITYTRATTDDELYQILGLQKENLKANVSSDEIEKEGYVTLQHNFDVLKRMNDSCAHVIAKDGDKLVGFALSMIKEFREDVALLQPMFEKIDLLAPNANYIVMGQICIDKAYRGQGIFRALYNFMRSELSMTFDLLITEVSEKNIRSLNAHKAVGFESMSYENHPEMMGECVLLAWKWK